MKKKRWKKERNCSQTFRHKKKTWLEAGRHTDRRLQCGAFRCQIRLVPLLWRWVLVGTTPLLWPQLPFELSQMSRSEQLCGEVCARTVPQCRAGTSGLVSPTRPHPSKVVTWDNIAPGCTVCPPKMKQNASYMQAFIKKVPFQSLG